MNGAPTAGWYDDPDRPGWLRRWDGYRWVDEWARKPSETVPPPVSTSPRPEGGRGRGRGAVIAVFAFGVLALAVAAAAGWTTISDERSRSCANASTGWRCRWSWPPHVFVR